MVEAQITRFSYGVDDKFLILRYRRNIGCFPPHSQRTPLQIHIQVENHSSFVKQLPFISPEKSLTIIPEPSEAQRRAPWRVLAEAARARSYRSSLPYPPCGRETDRSKESKVMASNKTLVPEAKQALNQFKMEAANEVGVTLNQGYNGQLTSAQAGSIGGQMVNNMNPVRTMRFERHNRISQGHKITVKYAFSLTV